MEKFVRSRLTVGILLGILSLAVLAEEAQVTAKLKEAEHKAEQGDLIGAAKAYNQVLQMDKNHKAARQGLAAVVTAAQIRDPHGEQTDVISALLGENETNTDKE